jgi:hypothetical protein
VGRRLPVAARKTLVVLAVAAALTVPRASRAQTPPPDDHDPTAEATELVNALLGGLMGGAGITEEGLEQEVAEAGGLPFRREVPVAFLSKDELGAYLKELLDAEYPVEQARADERLLQAFDLLAGGTGLRALRARVLEENVAGFYDERPEKRRLYAVSEDRSFTPMNQIVLAHELRHAQQDQYEDLYAHVSEDVRDFDDRRIAWVSLLEGDATLVMERFVRQRLGGIGLDGVGDDAAGEGAAGLAAPGLLELPGAPAVVRDQLVQPYLTGLVLARAIWARGGAEAMKEAWHRPPESTEQVLHPEKFFAGEPPRVVTPPGAPPAGGRLVAQGVLGELLLRTLLEQGAEVAAAGWGGDAFRLWDVGGRTALVWRSEWDTRRDAQEFHQALGARFARHRGAAARRGEWDVYGGADEWRFAVRPSGDAVELVSADSPELLGRLIER